MGRKALERVSQREYARRIGVSNEAVSRAIKDARIVKGWDPVEKKIIVHHANAEWGLLHMQENVEALLQDSTGSKQRTGTTNGLTLNGDSSYMEAKRVREIIQAQLVALDLKERKGELVNKEEVHKQLFSYGQQLRIAFTSLADRNIDAIIAAKTRAEAHGLLQSAIYEILEEVTTRQFDFTPRQ
jgi:hypothetical protein